jgi:hypothetical protein
MKKLLFFISFLVGVQGWGQYMDSIFVSQKQLADTIYNGLIAKAPTHYLANKLSLLGTDSLILKSESYNNNKNKYSNADRMMQWLYEMNNIAIHHDSLPLMDSVFYDAFVYVGEKEFDEDIIVIPLGIFELEYNSVDENEGLGSNILTKENAMWKDNDPHNNSIVSTHTSMFAGPLFDIVSSDVMGLTVNSNFFISNKRSIRDVVKLELSHNDSWQTVAFDQVVLFTPKADSIQCFSFRVTFSDHTELLNNFLLNTPELISNNEKDLDDPSDWESDADSYDASCSLLGLPWEPGCKDCGSMADDDGNKIKWCYIPSCSREGYDDEQPEKPYILVTGYRPPIFGQSFKKTWTIYNTHHQSMLQALRDNDFDIILVKFNIHMRPFQHGMQESAVLLERFLLHLNQNMKKGDYYENLIQGSSMGEDIVRLTLLTMEKKHFENPLYPHHHTRLNIAYDANFYGANIPLGYQYQIVSANYHPSIFGSSSIIPFFLQNFLYLTIYQKTVKELLMYHAMGTSDNILQSYHSEQNLEPKMHWRREGFLNALAAVDNGRYIFPLPVASRNIAISLGKIAGKNNEDEVEHIQFNDPGEYWQNISVLGWRYRIGAAKYTTGGEYFQLFKRNIPVTALPPWFVSVQHEINVTNMLEIDNSSGSYLKGIGNIIFVADWAYFPLSQMWNGRDHFTHKPIVTALGINRDLWPDDGSMTYNVQDFGLMYNSFSNFAANIKSDYYGYPNLGRPNDHFQVTPFEAIYIDQRNDPHIELENSPEGDKEALNNFIYNEAEPWYLGLQNQAVGSQARPDYTYYMHRRARNWITIGHLVTPTTDPGDFITEENAVVYLHAGEEIQVMPGTHFKAGSDVHLEIKYEGCRPSKSLHHANKGASFNDIKSNKPIDWANSSLNQQVMLYPNPSGNGLFNLHTQEKTINSVTVINMVGSNIAQYENLNSFDFKSEYALPSGTYLVRVVIGSEVVTLKLIVL